MKNTGLSSFSLTSRLTLRAASVLMVASSATGCVPAKNYEEVRSVAESEAKAHEHTRQRLEASMDRIHTLEQELKAREQNLNVDENATAESKLATAVATKEKEAAVELVEELRSELARTGDHLMIFAREKQDLAQTLLIAERRMADIELAGKKLDELVATTRDLSLALRDELAQGTVELGAREGQVVVGMKPDVLFGAEGGELLAPAATPLLAAVGKVSVEHPSLRVLVRESSGAAASPRLLRLGDALRERGVTGSRLVLPSSGTAAPPSTGSVAPASAPTPSDGAANADAAPAAEAKPSAPAAVAKYEIAFAP